ncbi:hypothetical protein ACSBR2_011025 [Camellia fascicularis]
MEGIAVTVALSLVEKVLSSLDRVPFQKNLHDQVEEVTNSLGTMQAYLRDMEGREGRSWVLKERMKQVRDIAYDTENVLDEIMLHVTYRYHRHRITKKTHEFFHNLAHWSPLHNTMSSKMEGIKERIVGITASDQLGGGGGGGGGDGGGSSLNSRPWVEHSDHIVSLQLQHGNEDEIVGFEKPREELICQLRGTEPRQKTMIISVVGPCGSGKSLLAKNVYGIIRSHELFDFYAWIRVSHSPKIEHILQSMLKQFCSSTKEPIPDHESAAVTPAKLWNYLQQKRFVVFLDDIWSIKDWENIQDALPNNSRGSRIVVTTRKLDVASFCSDEHHTHNLTCLSGPEAWKLFCKKAFQANKCPPELEDWSKKIMKRCEGNPHAIVAVGTLLSKKQQNPTVWKRMHDSLVSEVGTSSSLSIINKLLASYKDLPWNLQSCFLYFSVFPEDHSVERGRLVRLWIAEGFVEKTRGKTLEEVAEDYLNELVGSNLVHATWNFDGRVKDCRVLNFVLEFIIQKSEEENLVSVLAKTADTSLSEKFRRLSIHNPSCITQISTVFRSNSVLSSSVRSSSVRSTFFFKMDKLSDPSVITDMLGLPSFNLLRVLDFRDAPLNRFPEVIVRLTLLRYLSFRRTQIENIPKSIKKLLYLETLDLKQTGVTQLPKKINQLNNLRHLLLCRDRGKNHVWLNPDEGVEMVEGIGGLTNLQTLSLVKPDKNHKIIKELGDLTQLRKLGLIDLKREDGKDLCASIQRMESLSTLDVSSTGKQEPLDLADYHIRSHACPCPHLQHLYLKGHLPEFPKWISSLTNLFRIRLKWSGLTSNPLVALQDLPNLMELQMDDAFTGEELVFEAGGFKKLKMLQIEQFDHLHTVVVEEGSMSVLQKLTLRNCGQLKMLPLGINNLTRLKELLLYGMPTEFISGLQKGTEDREMVKHIDVIHSFILQDDGSWSLDQNLS